MFDGQYRSKPQVSLRGASRKVPSRLMYCISRFSYGHEFTEYWPLNMGKKKNYYVEMKSVVVLLTWTEDKLYVTNHVVRVGSVRNDGHDDV